MSGLYDRLLNQLGDDDNDEPGGLTPLDIAGLPDDQRRVMFALLRDKAASSEGISYDMLAEKLENPENLDGTLAELTRNNWLIRLGEPPQTRYKINLRRKRTGSDSLWSKLASRLIDDEPDESDSAADEAVATDNEDKTSSGSDDTQKPGPKPRKSGFPDISDW